MTKHLGLVVWAGTLVLAALAACSNASDDSSVARSSVASSPSPSPTAPSQDPSPSSPSDVAAANASGVLDRYFAVVDRVGQDPASSLRPLRTVMTSEELMAERRFFEAQHRRGERQTGGTRIAQRQVQSVNLDNSDPSAGKVPTVTVDVCWDVSGVDVRDKDGKSIVGPDRPDTGWTRYIVANYRFAHDPEGGWRVASAHDLKRTPCAAS